MYINTNVTLLSFSQTFKLGYQSTALVVFNFDIIWVQIALVNVELWLPKAMTTHHVNIIWLIIYNCIFFITCVNTTITFKCENITIKLKSLIKIEDAEERVSQSIYRSRFIRAEYLPFTPEASLNTERWVARRKLPPHPENVILIKFMGDNWFILDKAWEIRMPWLGTLTEFWMNSIS